MTDKRCLTFCGDQCDCPAREMHDTLVFIEPAFSVLASVCRTVGLKIGASKADEMHEAVRAHLNSKEPS